MNERRKNARMRSYLGGRVTFGDGCCVTACVVRNYSEGGALLDLTNAATMPSEFDLDIVAKDWQLPVRMVWRTKARMGVAFGVSKPRIVPIDMARRMRALEQTNESLRRRLSELGGVE